MKPLFSQDFLSNYISEFKLSNVPNIKMARDIIKNQIEELDSGKLNSLKEEEHKSRFIIEFFGDVLGFNCGNSNFWTLREEAKTKVDGTKPDGVLGFFTKNKSDDDVRAVIEIKDANTNLDNRQKRKTAITPVSQAFEYASKMGENCEWVIVSNFKEIRFYTAKFQGKCQSFNLKDLSNESKLKELLYLFHKDRFIKQESLSRTEQLYRLSNQNIKANEEPRHILEEIHSSLNRFKGLNYVDPDFIASIKPFNILDEHVWHYGENSNTLLTINPKIYYLFEQLNFDKGEIIISESLKEELENKEVLEYESKIDDIIRFLNHSQIFKISCVKDYKLIIKKKKYVLGFSHKHIFGFSDEDGFTKEMNILEYKPCDCISCNYRSFDFKHMLSKLKTAMYKDEFKTLEYGYGNYLVSKNNYKESYYTYKRVTERIKGKEGFEVEYFLAKLNMKYLHYLVLEDERLKDSFEVKKEIRNIDLDRILYEEIEYNVGDDVRNYLIKIKEEQLLLRTQDRVNELVEKINDLKQLHESGGKQHSGSHHFHELANHYNRLQLHLNKNRIIYNVFSKYKFLSANVFKGLLSSYLTKDAGIMSFHSHYLIEFVANIYQQDFQKILAKIDFIKLNDGCDEKIVKHITNLLNSYIDKGLFNDPLRSKLMQEYLLDYQFNDHYTSLVSNSFTLLSKIEISKKLIEPLSKLIIDFIKVEDDLAWYHLKQFSNLLYKKEIFFTSDQLIEILKIAIERDKLNNNKYEKLIEITSRAIKKFHPNRKISDKKLIYKLISNTNSSYKWRNSAYLLNITDSECSEILIKNIEEFLDKRFDYDFYSFLIRNKLYDYKKKDYFKKLVNEISLFKEKGFENEFDDGKPIFDSYRFYNFIILLNILKIDRSIEELNDLTEISEYHRWLLNPKEYDYSKFDAKWVLASNNKYLLQSFTGIKEIANTVEVELKREFNPTLSEIYYKYLA